jgi:competence protein ComEC
MKIPDDMMERVFKPLWAARAAFFAVGIALVSVPAWAAAGFLAIAGVIWRRFPAQRVEIVIAALMAAAGLIYMHSHELPAAPELNPSEAQVICGTIAGYPRVQEQRSSFIVKTDSDDPYRKCMQVFCDFEVHMAPGTAVKLEGVLQQPAPPGNPGEFNYPSYLSRHHIYYLLQVENPQNLRLERVPSRLPAVAPLLRSRMVERTREVLPSEEAGLLLAMVLGIIDNLDEDLYQDFQKTGLVHLFAVSGLNVGFVILFASWVIALGRFSRPLALVTTVLLVLLYCSLTGWPVSIQRAAIMALLSLAAGYAGRAHHPLNGLGLAALIILVIDPCALFTVSFQLSFLATWGLVGLYPAVKSHLKLQSRIWAYVLVPFCAQAAVLPLIAYYFHLITPVSLLSNVLATYLAGIIVILGFAALLVVVPFPMLSAVLLMPAGMCAHVLLWINAFCKSLPLAYWIVATPPLAVVGIYFAGLLWLTWRLSTQTQRCRFSLPLCLMVIAMLLMLIPPWWFSRGQLHLAFIDVGQGDSILLKTPANRFILIDGGGSLFTEVGRRKVLPYLNHLGVNRLYMVINTHPDIDHIQGLLEVMQHRRAEYVGIAAASRNQPLTRQLLVAAREQGSQIVALEQGQALEVDGLCMEVWYPPGEDADEQTANAQSLVLYCRYEDFSALLTADQNKANLEQVLREHRDESLIVKAPHHGSRYDWTGELGRNAEWLVISVGKNGFGHPHQEVLQDIKKSGARLLRTDRDGLVSFCTDGRELTVTTFKNGQL